MAEIKQRIQDDVKQAMRNKEKERLGTLRLILAAIKQKEVDDRTVLDNNQVLAVLDKLSKQHRDSIEQYEKAKRSDLVDKERAELSIVQSYLPEPLSDAEITALIETAIQKSGASSMQDMGKVMGLLKGELQGRADMGKVSGLVKKQIAGDQ